MYPAKALRPKEKKSLVSELGAFAGVISSHKFTKGEYHASAAIFILQRKL
jgi:hypothetical protein